MDQILIPVQKIWHKGGENISLRYVDRDSIVISEGDIVHRHIMMVMVCFLIDSLPYIEWE